jgi:hypothetical protein
LKLEQSYWVRKSCFVFFNRRTSFNLLLVFPSLNHSILKCYFLHIVSVF